MRRALEARDYCESRVFPRFEGVHEELDGNIKVFEKELGRFLETKTLVSRLIKYDEENRMNTN